MVEHVIEKTASQLKKSQVHPGGPVELAIPASLETFHSKTNQPQIRQRGYHQEPHQALRCRNMALVNVEASALLIGEERFDLEATLAEADCLLGQLKVCDQRHSAFMTLLMPEDHLDRPISLPSDRGAVQRGVALSRKGTKLPNSEGLSTPIFNKGREGRPAYVVEAGRSRSRSCRVLFATRPSRTPRLPRRYPSPKKIAEAFSGIMC